jgi:hypothetical protein
LGAARPAGCSPGGLAVDWPAAGTYDRSVGLSLFTLQITHGNDGKGPEPA